MGQGSQEDQGILTDFDAETKHGFGKHLWDVPVSVLTKGDLHVSTRA